MPSKSAICVIQGFVRENLELGWDHLEDGRIALAKRHFSRALEQVNEIEELTKQEALAVATQPPLIEI
jgi:hypothetical protein